MNSKIPMSRFYTVAGALIGFICLSASSSQAQTFLSEGFEGTTWPANQQLTGTAFTGTDGNAWKGNDNNNSASLVVQSKTTTAAPGGSQSLFIRDGSGSASPFAQVDWGTTISNGGYFEFSFRNASSAGTSTTTGNYGVTFINTGGSTINFKFLFSDTAGFQLTNSAGTALKTVTYAAAGYTPGSWVTFRVNFNETDNTASVALNGTSIAGLSIAAGEADGTLWQAGKVQITAGSNAAFGIGGYFDNVTAAIPEPSTSAAVLGALALFATAGYQKSRKAGRT